MTAPADWFMTGASEPPAPARIFCFAHAGGNAQTLLSWQPMLAGQAQIVAVCPPGRGHRAREPRPTLAGYIDGAAAAIAAATRADPRPSYLFGHSLGALVAFEVARRLAGQDTIRHLVISALAAPARLPSPRVRELAGLQGSDFARALVFFGGMPPELLAEEELQRLLLPGVLADFQMAAEYVYQPAAPLAVGASLIAGRQDPHVGAEELAGWQAEFQQAPDCRWADGGHFYFQSEPTALAELLLDMVRADQHVELI